MLAARRGSLQPHPPSLSGGWMGFSRRRSRKLWIANRQAGGHGLLANRGQVAVRGCQRSLSRVPGVVVIVDSVVTVFLHFRQRVAEQDLIGVVVVLTPLLAFSAAAIVEHGINGFSQS